MSFFCCTFAPAFRPKSTYWCHRISVSTQDFHSCKGGSTPPGTTKKTFPKINIPAANPLNAIWDIKQHKNQ